jgi:thiamine-phosphate pyrophosphorylase
MNRELVARIRVIAITDRRLMGGDIAVAIARALDGVPPGTVAIQVREKDLDGRDLLAMTRTAIEVAARFGAPVFVNDRVDVALAAGANGVHLPEAGMAVADVRRLAPDLAIGVSRHAAEAVIAEARGDADYIQLGPLHDSPGKGPQISIRYFQIIARDFADARQGRSRPRLIAVGGIDRGFAPAAATIGDHAVAMIRAAWTGKSLASVVESISP